MLFRSNIYERYAGSVFKYLMCLCHNADLSEELTQETFYQAVKSINSYNGTCKMSVWLCQIAKHSYYKYLERDTKRQRISIELLPNDGLSFDTPESELDEKIGKISIYRNIHSLDEPFKEITLLRVLGDLSFKEIGEIMGRNENWARVTFYRAKVKLREGIENNDY